MTNPKHSPILKLAPALVLVLPAAEGVLEVAITPVAVGRLERGVTVAPVPVGVVWVAAFPPAVVEKKVVIFVPLIVLVMGGLPSVKTAQYMRSPSTVWM